MSELVPHTDVPADIDQQMRLAGVLADSTLLPAHLRGKPANVLVVMQGARALNIPAFWALQSLHVIEGKLGMGADLMRALVLAAGHQFRVVKRDFDEAVVEIKRSDRDEPYRANYTWKEAQEAELTGKANWKRYRRAMLVARATGIAVRDECPEVLFGVLYTPDELGAVTDDEGDPVAQARTIEMPNPDAVAELAERLTAAAPGSDDFYLVWNKIKELGWALEKVPGSDESLVDVALAILAPHVLNAEHLDSLKVCWQRASDAGLAAVPIAGYNMSINQLTAKRRNEILEKEAAVAAATVGLNKATDKVDADAEKKRKYDAILGPPVEDPPVDPPPTEVDDAEYQPTVDEAAHAADLKAQADKSWEQGR